MEISPIAIDWPKFGMYILAVVVALAVMAMIINAIRTSRRVKKTDQEHQARVEEALHAGDKKAEEASNKKESG